MFFRSYRSTAGLNLRAGYSLLEFTIIIFILGIMAAVVIPNFSSSDPARLELAAQEIADAMRYARSESMRLGQPRGFRQQSGAKRIRVFRADTATTPWTPVYDVYHPLSRKLYDVALDSHAFAEVDSITANRVYRGVCNEVESVYFDASGTPRCANPETVLLDRFEVTLSLGSDVRVVSLNSVTGQVSIQ